MPVQDLTPQLRTRLSRVERGVGWFVMLASLLLLGGFAYYVYHTADQKGWFKIKVPYHAYLKDGTGLHVGDPVRMMGFDVGEITEVEGTEAGKNWFTENQFNVYVAFRVKHPYFGYIWTDSKVRIGTGDLLGKRVLEITKGSVGEPTVVWLKPVTIYNNQQPPDSASPDYVELIQQPKGFWIRGVDEAPAFTEHLDRIATQVEGALPGFFELTNQLSGVLSNSALLTARAADLLTQAQPMLTNFTFISSQLTNSNGSLGQWLIPTNLNARLEQTLTGVTTILQSADTNMAVLTTGIARSLDNVANITSNLNAQVQANDQMLTKISTAIVQADTLMQGLRKHWLLRSAFKSTNASAPNRGKAPPPRAGKHRD
jgi:hypothetical protein